MGLFSSSVQRAVQVCLFSLSAWGVIPSFAQTAAIPAPLAAIPAPAEPDSSARQARILEMEAKFPKKAISLAQAGNQKNLAGSIYKISVSRSKIIMAKVPESADLPMAYAVKDELIVTLKERRKFAQAKEWLRTRGPGYIVVREIGDHGVYLVRNRMGTGTDPWQAAAELRNEELFSSVEVNQVGFLSGNQHGITVHPQQWSIDAPRIDGNTGRDADVDGVEALSRLKYGSLVVVPVTVAVIDSGISKEHPALQNRLWKNPRETPNNKDDDGNGKVDDIHGWNFVHDNNVLTDNNSHGTHVAGIIAAEQQARGAPMGLAPNARLMILKVADLATFEIFPLADAIYYAVDNGAKVINMSVTVGPSPALGDAILYARGKDVTTVASAGNSAPGEKPRDVSIPGQETYPCRYPVSFCVTATDRSGNLAPYSYYSGNQAVAPVFAAPGSDILSTLPKAAYGLKSGTSMAAPHVVAAVALIRGAHPDFDMIQVSRQIHAWAEAAPSEAAGPRLNIYRALIAPKAREESDPENYCNQRIENTPRSWIVPFANSYEPFYNGTSPERAHTICSVIQLQALNTQLGQKKFYALMQDIDWNEIAPEQRFRIGKTDAPFQGTFMGLGNTLKNYDYSVGLRDMGLFVRIGPNGTVQNFRMINARLDAGDNIGLLAGISEGIIHDVQVEGVVRGASNVGGLVGILRRTVGGPTSSGRMTDVFFEGQVSGTATVGGIAGLVVNDAHLEKAFSKGAVSATRSSSAPAGGVAGELSVRSTMASSLAIAEVTSGDVAGGLVGALRCQSSVRDSYSEFAAETVAVTAPTAGGLIGVIENAAVENSYSLEVVQGTHAGGLVGANIDNSKGPLPGTFACSETPQKFPPSEILRSFYTAGGNGPGGGGLAKTPDELLKKTTFEGWSFTENWDIQSNESPSLRQMARTR